MSTDDREVTLRGPAERDEPCPAPWPVASEAPRQCVHPFGHGVHWNGAGDVWLSDLPAAEARGYRKAVEHLLDRERRQAWLNTQPDGVTLMSINGVVAYLEATEGDDRG